MAFNTTLGKCAFGDKLLCQRVGERRQNLWICVHVEEGEIL